jgi:hypothetical protein
MVFGIAKQSGGYVWVESAPARGSTFFMLLPRTHPLPEVPAPTECSADRIGNETILVVEDQNEVRRLASVALRKSGYTVVEAANGNEAVALTEMFPDRIDLLVSDVVMPGISGGEVAKRLRERWPGLKVLFISGYSDDLIVRKATSAKDAGFLQKPFTSSILTAKVREILDTAPAGNKNTSRTNPQG